MTTGCVAVAAMFRRDGWMVEETGHEDDVPYGAQLSRHVTCYLIRPQLGS
jgi:hypothetical protein